jgi:ribosomal protein L7/L12
MNNEILFVFVLALCTAILIILIRFLLANRQKDKISYTLQQSPPPDKRDLGERVSDLLEQDKRLEAVRLVREQENLSLNEAENFVDSFATGIVFSPTGENKPLSTEELEEKVFVLLLQNKKLEAINMVQENKLVGLDEAKEIVEQIERRHNGMISSTP